MPCRPIGGGAWGFVCSRPERAKPCAIDGCRAPSSKLCDYPLTGRAAGKTCDRPMCAKHARTQAAWPEWIAKIVAEQGAGLQQSDTIDLCPTHDAMAKEAR